MTPAQQRLEPDDFQGVAVAHRLIGQREVLAADRVLQILLDQEVLVLADFHRGIEQAKGLAPGFFRAIQRQVGVAQKQVGAFAVLRIQGDADRDADQRLRVPPVQMAG